MTGGSGTTGSTTGSGTQPAVEPQERAVAPAARLEEPLVVQQEEAQVAVPQAAVRAAGSFTFRTLRQQTLLASTLI